MHTFCKRMFRVWVSFLQQPKALPAFLCSLKSENARKFRCVCICCSSAPPSPALHLPPLPFSPLLLFLLGCAGACALYATTGWLTSEHSIIPCLLLYPAVLCAVFQLHFAHAIRPVASPLLLPLLLANQ